MVSYIYIIICTHTMAKDSKQKEKVLVNGNGSVMNRFICHGYE